MKYRTYPNSDVTVSEVGFGLWTTSTGWWGSMSDDEAVAMLREAHDLGITLFDAADTYGNGRSEEQLASAFDGGAKSRLRDEVRLRFHTQRRASAAANSNCRTISRRRSFARRWKSRCAA